MVAKGNTVMPAWQNGTHKSTKKAAGRVALIVAQRRALKGKSHPWIGEK